MSVKRIKYRLPQIIKYQNKILGGFGLSLLLLIVVYSAVQFQTRQAETVLLSNGKRIHLGESRGEIEKNLGNQIKSVRGNYEYFGSDNRKIVEAIIYMTRNRVEGIDVAANTKNQHLVTGGHISTAIKKLEANLKGRSVDINPSREAERLSGMRVVGANSVVYFLRGYCQASPKVTSWALLRKGRERLVLSRIDKDKCDVTTKKSTE